MERPEEKKNDQVVEKIPEKLMNPITDAMKAKNQLTQKFLQISFQLAGLQQKSQEALEKLQNNGKNIGQKMQRAFDKMKLGKRKSYTWRYDGKGNFIGVPRPQPKKKEVK